MRKILILTTVLLVLVVAAIIAATNLNHYLQENREWVATQASSALGRSVAFDEIGVSLRSGLGARITDVSIAEDPAFGTGEFLRARRVDAVIKILPALFGRYEIAHIEIDAPEIRIVKTPSGFNFDSLGGAERDSKRADPSEDSAARALPLVVSSLQIRAGRLQFTDRSASPPSELKIEQLDLEASDLGFDRPIELELSAAVLGVDAPNVRTAGTLGPLGSLERASSAPVDLRIDLGPIVIDRLKTLALIGPSVPPELASADPIELTVTLSGTLDALGTAVSMDASDAAIAYGEQFAKPKGVRFAVDGDVKLLQDALDVARFDLRLADAHLTGSGRIGLADAMPIDFKLSGRDLPLEGWGKLIPAATAIRTAGAADLDLSAKGPVGDGRVPNLVGTLALKNVRASQPGGDTQIENLTTTLTLKGDRVEIPPTEFKLNGNPVKVTATVKNISNLDTDFDIRSPALDIAALGAGGEGVKKREVLENLEMRGNFRSTASGPRLDATLRSSGGNLRDVAYQALDAKASLRGQRFELEQVTLRAFDGSVTGAGSYDRTRVDDPNFSFRGKLGALDVGALVSHFRAGDVLKMVGRLNANLDVDGHGPKWEIIRDAMQGTGALEVEDGVLSGLNIAERALGGLTGIPGLSNLIPGTVRGKYPQLFGMDDTVFESLGAKMNLKDGVALLSDVVLAARDYRLDGKGTIRLDNALDIAMSFVASDALTADLLRSVKELKHLTDSNRRFNFPLRLAGSSPKIKVVPDTQYVAQRLTQSLVQTGISKGLEALVGKPKAPQAPANRDSGSQTGPAAETNAGSTGESISEQGTESNAASKTSEPTPAPDLAEELLRQGLGALLGGDGD